MSMSRPWTAVLRNQSQTKIVDSNAPIDCKLAQVTISKENPGWELMALIPGSHSRASHSFSTNSVAPTSSTVDPFDMSHIVR